jgi:hypothetical protein
MDLAAPVTAAARSANPIRRQKMIFPTTRHPLVLSAVSLLLLVGAEVSLAVAADPQPPKVSAKDLTAEFVKDPATAAKKYGDAMNPKEVIVEGTVVDLVDGTYGKIAKLQGEGKVVVSCLLRKEDESGVKKGDTVTIRGRCRGLFKKDNSVDLNGGVLIKDK